MSCRFIQCDGTFDVKVVKSLVELIHEYKGLSNNADALGRSYYYLSKFGDAAAAYEFYIMTEEGWLRYPSVFDHNIYLEQAIDGHVVSSSCKDNYKTCLPSRWSKSVVIEGKVIDEVKYSPDVESISFGAGYFETPAFERIKHPEQDPPKPKVKPRNPDVLGALDKRIVQKVVRQHQGELRECYERALASQDSLNGEVTVQWIVTKEGLVKQAEIIGSTLDTGNMGPCIENNIKNWRFPAPKDEREVWITHSFGFYME